MPVSSAFLQRVKETSAPGDSTIVVNGTYHPEVTVKWTKGAELAPEVFFTEGEGSRATSAVLIINGDGFIDSNTTIFGETGTQADSMDLFGSTHVESVMPGEEGFIGFGGKLTVVDGVDVYKGQAFEWDATYLGPEGEEVPYIPSLACWPSQARDVLDLDELYGDQSDSDESAQKEAEDS